MDVSKYYLTCKDSELETMSSLIYGKYPINRFKEDSDNYYIKQNTGDPYYHTMWVISKKTGESHPIDLLDFMFEIEDQTTIVDPPYDRLLRKQER